MDKGVFRLGSAYIENGQLVICYDPTGYEICTQKLDNEQLEQLRAGWKAAVAEEAELNDPAGWEDMGEEDE